MKGGIMATSRNPSAGATGARWVAWLCWAAVALEGFDLVVLGTVTPTLLDYEPWGLTPGEVGVISSWGLVGVMIGALCIGTVTDLVGRRRTMLLSVVWFSVFTALLAAAPAPWAFGTLRFLAGLGRGGVLPTALALVSEYVPSERSSASITFTMTGYHVGGVLTAVLAIPLLDVIGWRGMFLIGAVPALFLVPLMLRKLPESPTFLLAAGRREEAEELAGRYGIPLAATPPVREDGSRDKLAALRTLFTGRYLPATIAFWVASFMGLLLVYGLNQWLPQIMRQAGYELGAAITFLLVLNVGAVIGLLFAGRVADRFGSKPANAAWFALASVFLFLLSAKLPLPVTYLVVLLAGVFVFSGQVLVYAYVGRYYPAGSRATAIGWASGIGRIGAITGPLVGGFLVGNDLAVPWGFYAFAITGVIALVAVSLVPRSPAEADASPAPARRPGAASA
jgi:AAHS family benzoate transporter-like MFS transporter